MRCWHHMDLLTTVRFVDHGQLAGLTSQQSSIVSAMPGLRFSAAFISYPTCSRSALGRNGALGKASNDLRSSCLGSNARFWPLLCGIGADCMHVSNPQQFGGPKGRKPLSRIDPIEMPYCPVSALQHVQAPKAWLIIMGFTVTHVKKGGQPFHLPWSTLVR